MGKDELSIELINLIKSGENITVEFKQATNALNKDVYDTVCAFCNREGGHIFLGIKDKTNDVLGIDPDAVDKIKKDLVTGINNKDILFPPQYLSPIEYVVSAEILDEEGINHYDPNDKGNKRKEYHLIYIRVPGSPNVVRRSGRIFDRNHDSDVDVTDNEQLVYQIYARKQSTYFVNKVYPIFQYTDLRKDLIDRARRMALAKKSNHEWQNMSDEEMLRTAGLILTDEVSGKQGVTLAAILLFGTDNMIMSVLAHHKTDAILRIINQDRYDDRDVIITNLIESYDRLMEFGQRHLNDRFVMEDSSNGSEGLESIQSISARDKILREIVSNMLAHRDYSNAYVAKMIIQKEQIIVENANRAHGFGDLDIMNFEPFPKNPPISKIFREIGLADELGSGMRNSYKYTKMYSGGIPTFTEGDIFRITIPLSPASTVSAGPDSGDELKHSGIETDISLEQLVDILEFCEIPRSRAEIQERCGYKSATYFKNKILNPLIIGGQLVLTIPEKPKHPKQKYVRKKSKQKM